MKAYTLFACLFMLFLLSSCTEDFLLDRKEDRIEGAWRFETARYRDEWALFGTNVMDDYYGDVVEFYRDYTVEYDDYDTGRLFYGDWNIFLDRDYYDDDSDIEYFLDVDFYNDRNRFAFEWNAEITLLTYNKLNMRVRDRNGVYTFKLRRF